MYVLVRIHESNGVVCSLIMLAVSSLPADSFLISFVPIIVIGEYRRMRQPVREARRFGELVSLPHGLAFDN
jgi:hypothetical protein